MVKLGEICWSFSAARAEKTQHLIKYLFKKMEQYVIVKTIHDNTAHYTAPVPCKAAAWGT